MKLGSHAFMAHELGPAQQLIRDILDGYFPFALKDVGLSFLWDNRRYHIPGMSR